MTLLQRPLRPLRECAIALRTLQSSFRPAGLAKTDVAHQIRRGFLSNPFTQNQTLTATRTLRYPSSVIYNVISDVAAYNKFVPYCQGSIVTKTSNPAPDGKRYPEEAKLLVGFNNDISESFVSRVYCVPERIVEAVSGSTQSTLPSADIAHHSPRPPADQDLSQRRTTMSHLLTRWTLRPGRAGKETTEVNLTIEFSFANPLYAALSSAAAPKVADKMIDAFEKRVKAVAEETSRGPAANRISGVIRDDK